ncbi:MAG TPA: type I-D CRISPR-associated helicase Cas3' [Ardenticatenaceae bacterium]|nr:type I-D CRISPR-associated helicase Cas3' [Ardenticatenaceae bacterium]
MSTFTLEPQSERLAPEGSLPGLDRPLLYHQWRTREALRDSHLVVNTYNTGSGKTLAALLRLLDLNGRGKNVLFIAPTNALIQQHAADIRAFVAANQLEYLVAEVNASRLRELLEGTRPGDILRRLLQNPQEFHEWFGLEATDYRKYPVVLVVNPDIFYYAIYFRYGRLDQANVFLALTRFDYVVIDEFHYYNAKQFASFLFYFLLVQQFGAFEEGQRICLLSATPSETMQRFLERTFGSHWTLLSPSNEPVESRALRETPALTALEVTVFTGEVQEWAKAAASTLELALARGEHGAIISSALWRINDIYALLSGRLGASQLGRITGPEPAATREAATARALILATPTVDIGYNFQKLGKPRQNIDFLTCDARFADEVVQRVGRAGRVLGKAETDIPSRAVLVLPPDVAETFRALDGRTLSRPEFARWLAETSGLPAKHDLNAYIRNDAITECFYPISKLRRLLPPELEGEMDALYERVCEVFAPGLSRPAWRMRKFFTRYYQRQHWAQSYRTKPPGDDDETVQMIADWMEWGTSSRPEHDLLKPVAPRLLRDPVKVAELRDFVEGQVVLAESLFAFRDAFQGPRAVVYDRDHLLSSETINTYDLLHVLAYYDYEIIPSRTAFCRSFGETELDGDCYVRLHGFRTPKLSIELQYESSLAEPEWKRRFCRRPVALKGFGLLSRERGGGLRPLAATVQDLLATRFVPALIVPPADAPAMHSRLRGTALYPRRLSVSFPDDVMRDDYFALLGTAAWLAQAELRTHFLLRERAECDAIIL